jgi:hypothetical protein
MTDESKRSTGTDVSGLLAAHEEAMGAASESFAALKLAVENKGDSKGMQNPFGCLFWIITSGHNAEVVAQVRLRVSAQLKAVVGLKRVKRGAPGAGSTPKMIEELGIALTKFQSELPGFFDDICTDLKADQKKPPVSLLTVPAGEESTYPQELLIVELTAYHLGRMYERCSAFLNLGRQSLTFTDNWSMVLETFCVSDCTVLWCSVHVQPVHLLYRCTWTCMYMSHKVAHCSLAHVALSLPQTDAQLRVRLGRNYNVQLSAQMGALVGARTFEDPQLRARRRCSVKNGVRYEFVAMWQSCYILEMRPRTRQNMD